VLQHDEGDYAAVLTDQLGLWAGAQPARFRPIHYLGSKARLLEEIGASLDLVDPGRGRVVDLFTGSGVVAAHLARTRDVIAVDIQEYSRVIAASLLTPTRLSAQALVAEAREREAALLDTPIAELVRYERACYTALADGDAEPLCELIEHGSALAAQSGEGPPDGPLAEALAAAGQALGATVLTRLYGGVYFSYRHALELDCLTAAVRGQETGLAAVMSAASECVTSVGNHFAQPLRPRDRDGRPKLATLRAAARRRESDVFAHFANRVGEYAALPAPTHAVEAVRADYRDFLATADGITAVYADPPYTRDHYSRFYHVLETIALGDDPGVSNMTVNGETKLSRGLYRPDRHQSPFCIRSEVPGAFAELFAGVRRHEAPLVLSYSPYTHGTAARPQPRLLTIPELVELAKAHFRDVGVVSAGPLAHSKFNATRLNGDATDEAEVFVICRP
jgi:16S rRNA G966 N2-methylase RsmD